MHLDLAPGAVIVKTRCRQPCSWGAPPSREALQRLVRDQFVTVMPRRGMYVSSIDVGDLALLYETRAIEPYAMRLACARTTTRVSHTASLLEGATADATPRRCWRSIAGAASWCGGRPTTVFLTDHLDTLYADSDRLWHLYLGDVADLHGMIAEHRAI